jgi:hypothetical protein
VGGGTQPVPRLLERFAVQVMEACRTLTEGARLLRITWDQAQRIKERAVRRGLARCQKAVIPHIGIDEPERSGAS